MVGRKRVESARTEARERAHSDGHHAITAGQHTSVSAGQSFLVSARQAIRLFAYKAGMKLVAAAGKVHVQAQKDGIEVSALKDIQIVSLNGEVHITASKKIVVNGGGSFSEWSAGGITHGTAGSWMEHAAMHDSPGPANAPLPTPSSIPQVQPAPEQLLLRLMTQPGQSSGVISAGEPYELLKGGAVIDKGLLDDSGHIVVKNHTASTQKYQVRLSNGTVFDAQVEPALSTPAQRHSNAGHRGHRNGPGNASA